MITPVIYDDAPLRERVTKCMQDDFKHNAIKQAQEALGFPLLHSVTGGRGGGGAELTPEAVRMMAAYDDYCRKLRAYADDLFQEEFGYLQEG